MSRGLVPSLLLTSLFLSLFLVGPAAGAEPVAAEPSPEPAARGREIMREVDERPAARDIEARALWRIRSRSGSERTRDTRMYRRDRRGEPGGLRAQWLVVVDAPAAVRGTALLVWSHADPDAADDQWLYLPAYRKLRRIAGRDRGGAFLSSDFSFEDLTSRGLDEDTHRHLRDEDLDGVPHAVVESLPRRSDPSYAQRVHWVDPGTRTVSRTELYDADGELEKTLRAWWEHLNGYWTATRLEMTHAKTGSRTRIHFEEIVHDSGLEDRLFSKSALRLGVR